MHLYNLTLQKSTAIYSAIQGNFSGTRFQEIAISKGKILELLKPEPTTGKLNVLTTIEVFGIIRSMIAFRQTGSNKDYLILGSDSGKITILEYNTSNNKFDIIHMETFGKTGCRRIVPGQYLAMDPKGRAVMIGSIEKQKFVYVLNRDSEGRLTISSPLEAHKSFAIVFSMVGVDVGFENPLFCCLEMDYEESDKQGCNFTQPSQMLTYYELDLGLNHVVRKMSEPLNLIANLLFSVPGGTDGPGGVIVCCENFILYKNLYDESDEELRIPIPKRKDDLDNADRKVIIVSGTSHKTKTMFFFLLQTDQGDIFKLSLVYGQNKVTDMMLKYFDTLDVISTSFCILRSGFLFVPSEFSNHQFYQIIKLGDDDSETDFSAKVYKETETLFYFQTKELQNLVLVNEISNYSPIIDCNVVDILQNDNPQIHLLSGRGKSAQFGILTHGLEVNEMAVSELPGNPIAVWTLKFNDTDIFDSYIVVSFLNATLLLSVGETVEEVQDSGFLNNVCTIGCALVGKDSLIQIYSGGIRHIRSDQRINEWRCPDDKQIEHCAINVRQIAIVITGEELVYFELDQTGQLSEFNERKELPTEIVCMSLGPVLEDEQRSRFLAIALKDNTVRIISLLPNQCLMPLSMQALPASAESLCIIETSKTSLHADETYYDSTSNMGLLLHIGLSNGVLLRTVLDSVTGDLTDTRTRYLGSRPVKLYRLRTGDAASVLAISSRNWLSYQHLDKFHLSPLSYDILEYAHSFSSEQCPEGIVAIKTDSLHIISIDNLGTLFEYKSVPLKYTPRKLLLEPSSNKYFVTETDNNSYTQKELEEIRKSMAIEMRNFMLEQTDCGITEETIEQFISSSGNLITKAGPGFWASLLRVIDPFTMETEFIYEFEQDEAAFSLCLAKFPTVNMHDNYLIVGVAKNYLLNPRYCDRGYLYTFKIHYGRSELSETTHINLEFIHKTPIEEVPGAMVCFQGRLLVGVGKLLRIYELGRQKLLKKCEYKKIPQLVTNISILGHRIIVQDVQESFHYLKYKPNINELVAFADDTYPRYITKGCILDWNTIAGGDKFGNFNVSRLSAEVKDEIEEDPTGVKSVWDKGMLNGAPQKLELEATYYLGETIHSIQKTSLIPGGSECIFYTTLSGSIGIFAPLNSIEDAEFFQHLEMHLRQEYKSIVGRDHLSYRSAYWPVKNITDGDLCELYNSLDIEVKQRIAEELDRTPSEILKKLEEIRNRYAF